MTRPTKKRSGLRSLLALALGAAALLVLAGLAVAKDGNDDRIPDGWEKKHDLSLTVDQSRRDQDHDQLRNRAEFRTGNNPRNDDSDGDGVADGQENAGTIASFDATTGRLVIDLFGSDTIAGVVTERTRIKCEDEHSVLTSHSREAEPGDDRGGHGEEESGDDNSGHGNEPGDDNGGGDEPGDDHGGGDNSGPGSEHSGSGSDNSGPGSQNSGPSGHDDNGVGANCTTADLIVGSVVQEADLEIEHGVATFDEVELAHSS